MEAFHLMMKKSIRKSILIGKIKIPKLWHGSLNLLMIILFLILDLKSQLMVYGNIWRKLTLKVIMLNEFSWNLNWHNFLKTLVSLMNFILVFLISGLSTQISSILQFHMTSTLDLSFVSLNSGFDFSFEHNLGNAIFAGIVKIIKASLNLPALMSFFISFLGSFLSPESLGN